MLVEARFDAGDAERVEFLAYGFINQSSRLKR